MLKRLSLALVVFLTFVVPAVALPAGTTNIWRVYTSAQAGRLDVVALLGRGSNNAYWATQEPLPK